MTIGNSDVPGRLLLTNAASLFFCMAAAALLNVGCSKKTPVAEAEPALTETNATTVQPAEIPMPAPPIVFSDASQQRRFDVVYRGMAQNFAPPTPGMLIRIYTMNGGRIEGELVRFNPDGVVISTQDGPVMIDRSNMTAATEESLYADAFSRNLAEKQVNLESGQQPLKGLDALFFKVDQAAIVETRRITADMQLARTGPGRYYTTNGETFYRGESVLVIYETNDWICIKRSKDSVGSAGWIPRFSSFMTSTDNKDQVSREIDKLFKSGFLVDINPKKNEALVDLYEWRIADTAVAEGKSRMLAIYCGQQKNSRLFWVDIKDALTGKKLAEFSVSKGFKVY